MGKGLIKDRVGQKFGRLTVLKLSDRRTLHQTVIWICRCDCSNIKEIPANDLAMGKTKSCGCLKREIALAQVAKLTKHGQCYSRIYKRWAGMMRRCYDSSKENFNLYGGRGISVCKRWHSFEKFYKDMGEVPFGMTLDRIDTNGNYEPSNCRWATPKQQSNNRTNNKIIEWNGQKKTLSQWATDIGMSINALWARFDHSWGVEKALTTPLRVRR